MSRSILRSLLDRTVQHKRPAFTVGTSGARTPTFAVQNADVPAAIWPMGADPNIASAFDRQDIVTDHVICTDSDLAVKAKDIVTEGDDVYVVEGSMLYRNAGVANVTVYLVAANKRIV